MSSATESSEPSKSPAGKDAYETARRLTLAMKAGRLGDWTWDAATDVVNLSSVAAEIIGQPVGVGLTWQGLRDYMHPDDIARSDRMVDRALTERTDYETEYRLRRPDGTYAWIAVFGTGVYGADGTLASIIGVAQEITGRKVVEETLRARDAELNLISANAPAVLSHWDRHHRLIFASHAFADRWKKTPQQLLGKSLSEILGTEAVAALQPFLDRVLAGETVAFEMEVPYDEIGRRYVQVSYAPDLGEDGAVRGYLAAVLDMTDRRRAEIALVESEERLRMATRTGKIGLWDWDVVNDRITWTESLYEIHGVRPGEFENTVASFAALIHPEDRGPVQRAIQSSLEHDARYELEFRAVRPGGGVIWLFTNASVMREGGRPVRMVGATLDVTARKTAELGLRESEARFRTLVSHAPVGIFLTDANGEGLFANETLRAISGQPADQFRGRKWSKAVHPDDRDRVEAEWYACVRERRSFASEYRYLRPDGSVIWLQASAVESRNANGVTTGFIGTVIDITQRKQAVDGLRESEKRFRTLASHAPVGIFLTNAEGDTVFVNEAWTTMVGLGPGSAQGRGWVHAIHPDDRARVKVEWEEAVRAGKSSSAEYRFLRGDGSITWVQGNAVQLRDDAGQPAGYIGTIADVTQRKETEEILRAQEAQLRLISTNAPIILAHCSREQRFLFVNRAYAERFRLEPAEIIGRTIVEILGAEAHGVIEPFIVRVLAGEAINCEVEVPYRQVGRRFMQVAYVPHLSADGSVCGWLSAMTDVTERRQMENALRESEERFRTLADNIAQFAWVTDAAGRQEWVNERFLDYTGLTLEQFRKGEGVKRVHPDHLPRVTENHRKNLARGQPWEELFPFQDRAGQYHWFLTRGVPIRDAEGRVVRWFGTNTDVTELREIQETLRQRTKSLEALNRVGSTLAAERDLEKILQSVTDAGREVTGAAFGAFFYNVNDGEGEAYQLYTLSGISREAFAKFPMPQATALFGPAFRGEGVVRIADVSCDPRYGQDTPHEGPLDVPPALCSFMAVPVISRSGDVIGGLFYGHPEPDRFSAEAERTLVGVAAQAAIAIDNANLYQALSAELEQKSKTESKLRAAQEQLQRHATELEQKVAERTASLREAIVQMEEFSYSVSHDLRAPLRAMNAYAQALAEDYGDQLDDTAKGYLDRIRRSSRRMENLTHDVLTYSRVARAEMELTEVNLESLLRDITSQYAELQPPAADVQIIAPLHRVLGHESSLGQCLANLLTNAVKFIEPEVRPQVRVRTELLADRVRVWVEDNGIGIAPEYQANLFRVFERVPTRRTYEGTGIGLAIVRKAAEKMNGRCGVESDGRSGSRFWIELARA